VIPELVKQYVDTGKARFVFREFPLTSIHPNAQKAAEAAVCAGRQGKYWEMNGKLFATQDEWSGSSDASSVFKTYAGELGLDKNAFNQCLDEGKAALEVQGELMLAESLGLRGTPSFMVNDLLVQNPSVEALGSVIDYLSAGGTTPEIVPMTGDPRVLGDFQTAVAVTVAFVDYSSSESAQHALEVLPKLKTEYIDTGKMIYVLHPWTSGMETPGAQAAIAAECAGEGGKYWEMHDRLFQEQKTWTQAKELRPLFTGYAEDLGLDTAKFVQCLDSDSAKLRVQAGNVLAAQYGVPSAPVFLFNNGQGKQGSPTFEEFKAVIDSIVSGMQ
jgi:protein-disulfide isomerase